MRNLAFAMLLLAGCATLLLAGCASGPAQQVERVPTPGGLVLPVWLSRPEGPGPFPSLILLHACNGFEGTDSQRLMDAYQQRFLARFWLVAMPDSFAPRGQGNVCANQTVHPAQRVGDVRAVADWLLERGLADPARIFVLGRSHGGSTVAALAALPPEGRARLAGGIALYPGCLPELPVRPELPMLMLLAGRDDWTPPAPCLDLHVRRLAAGAPSEMQLYPAATHAFDQDWPLPVRYLGHTLAQDRAATEDARRRIDGFLDRLSR